MTRAKLPEGKRVTICAKVSEPTAAEIDAARGEMSRSAWVQAAITLALGGKPARAARRSGKPESRDAPHRCPAKGWCGSCGEWKGSKK
jgi:hypothetical protein